MRASHVLPTAALLLAAAAPLLAAPAAGGTTTGTGTTSRRRDDDDDGAAPPRRRRLRLHGKRAGYATTANEVVDGKTTCRAVTVVYARGTTQDGNIGAAGDVGPVFMDALAAALGGADRLAVQGVDYDADVTGFLGHLTGLDDEGIEAMAKLVSTTATQCPKTKIVMAGYSQGGQVLHGAADTLKSNPTATNQVAAVVIFGDPKKGDAVGNIAADKVKTVCHDGDLICEGSVVVLPPHLNYQEDAPAAAQFVVSKVK